MDNLIHPLKGSAVGKEEFAVLDIENESTGEVICIGLSYRLETGSIEHVIFYDWFSFTNYLAIHSARVNALARIWAHNGGGWDWCSYFAWLLKNRHAYTGLEIHPVIVGSKYVVIHLDFGCTYTADPDKPDAGLIRKPLFSVKLCDSLYLMRSGLDKLGKTFLGRGKLDTGDMMAWDLWRVDKAKFYQYLERDCETLLLCLERFYSIIREHIAPLDHLGSTIGSTALRLYRTSMPQVGENWSIKDGIQKTTPKRLVIEIPTDARGHKELRAILREGYSGGRVEVFQYGHFQSVRVFDINSLYPFVMREHHYPTSPRTIEYIGSKYPHGINGIFTASFEQPRINPVTGLETPPCLTVAGKGVYIGRGTFFSPELDLLRKVGGSITVEKGYIFQDCKPIFREYIDKMWTLRKSDYTGALGMVCKFLMNSLYGKFCEKPKTDKLLILAGSVWENIQHITLMEIWENKKREAKKRQGITVDILDEAMGAYMIHDHDAICNNEHVGIGGLITSWARVELYKRFIETGFSNLLYCDTDSIHTLGTCKTGDNLGELKREHEGEAVYCGKKMYALRGSKNGKAYEKVTAKGVAFCSSASMGSGRNRQLHPLDFSDMLRIYRGDSILCNFSQPATAREVIAGKRECQILRYDLHGGIKHNRKRTLRRT